MVYVIQGTGAQTCTTDLKQSAYSGSNYASKTNQQLSGTATGKMRCSHAGPRKTLLHEPFNVELPFARFTFTRATWQSQSRGRRPPSSRPGWPGGGSNRARTPRFGRPARPRAGCRAPFGRCCADGPPFLRRAALERFQIIYYLPPTIASAGYFSGPKDRRRVCGASPRQTDASG